MADFIVIDEIQGYIDKAVEKRMNYSISKEVDFVSEDGIPNFLLKTTEKISKYFCQDFNGGYIYLYLSSSDSSATSGAGIYRKKINSTDAYEFIYSPTGIDSYTRLNFFQGELYVSGLSDGSFYTKFEKVNVSTKEVTSLPACTHLSNSSLVGSCMDSSGNLYRIWHTGSRIYAYKYTIASSSWSTILNNYYSSSDRDIFATIMDDIIFMFNRYTSGRDTTSSTVYRFTLSGSPISGNQTVPHHPSYYIPDIGCIYCGFSYPMVGDESYVELQIEIYKYTPTENNNAFMTISLGNVYNTGIRYSSGSYYNTYSRIIGYFVNNSKYHIGVVLSAFSSSNDSWSGITPIFSINLKGNRLYLKQGNVVKTDASIYNSVGDKITIPPTGVETDGVYSFYGNTYLTIFNKGE